MKAGMDQMCIHLLQLITNTVAKVQAEADKRIDAVIQRLKPGASVTLKYGITTQSKRPKPFLHSKQVVQPTWASIAVVVMWFMVSVLALLVDLSRKERKICSLCLHQQRNQCAVTWLPASLQQ
jgi:hypothetical protein